MRITRLIMLAGLAGLISLTGCSQKQMYESLQKRNEAQCMSLPLAQQQACLEEVRGPDYDRYQEQIKRP